MTHRNVINFLKPEDVKKKGFPLLKAIAKDDMITVWCPYCCSFHHHSWYPPHEKRGYASSRVAHCRRITLFNTTDYYIMPFSRKEIEKMNNPVIYSI